MTGRKHSYTVGNVCNRPKAVVEIGTQTDALSYGLLEWFANQELP